MHLSRKKAWIPVVLSRTTLPNLEAWEGLGRRLRGNSWGCAPLPFTLHRLPPLYSPFV